MTCVSKSKTASTRSNITSNNFHCLFPILVTYKEKSSDEESSQVFIPFVCDVRVGSEPHLIGAGGAGGPTSLDLDDSIIGSPPPEGVRLTPPSSPHVGGTSDGTTILQSAGAKERLVNK